MKRVVGLTAALALLLGGTAQARPWLTFHHAKTQIGQYVRQQLHQDIVSFDCARFHRTTVTCDVLGVTLAGDNGGPELQMPAGWTNDAGTYIVTCLTAHRSRAGVAVHFDPADPCV